MEICCCPEQCVQNTLLWLAIKVFGHREVCSWKMDDLKQEMKKIDRTLKREDDEIRKIQNSAYLTAVIKLKMINPKRAWIDRMVKKYNDYAFLKNQLEEVMQNIGMGENYNEINALLKRINIQFQNTSSTGVMSGLDMSKDWGNELGLPEEEETVFLTAAEKCPIAPIGALQSQKLELA